MKIQVLGPGCPKCKQLVETTEEIAKELNIEYDLEKITDVNDIMTYGVFMTPGLVVDGQVKSVGKIPSKEEIKNMLK